MSRPRRGTEAVFFDTFADWPAADQAAALKVLEALHRQTQRQESRDGRDEQRAHLQDQERIPEISSAKEGR